MVEFALVAPLAFLMIFLTIDFGRLVYTYTAISSAAREGERIISLKPQQSTDCYALAQMEKMGQAFPLVPDPSSLSGNSDPNNPTGTLQPTAPPLGTGYIYIWPAVAVATPQDTSTNCTGSPRRGSGTIRQVAVSIEYHFKPLTPLIGSIASDITIRTVSVGQTEY